MKLIAAEKALDDLWADIAAGIVGVDEECEGNDGVNTQTHGALQVVALSVLDEVVHNQDGNEKDDGLETLEVQRHGLVHDPAEDNEEGSHEKGDLHRAADGHVDSEIHLALVCDDDGCDVLGGVSNDGDQNETDECLADVRRLDNRVDAVNKELGANGDHDGHNNKRNTGGGGRQDLALLLVIISSLVLNVGEQVVVRVELEVEVQHVEDEQDDGGAVR